MTITITPAAHYNEKYGPDVIEIRNGDKLVTLEVPRFFGGSLTNETTGAVELAAKDFYLPQLADVQRLAREFCE